MGKYLDSAGVTTLYGKMKEHVASVAAAKQDALVSGTNIKTINGETLLGSGDITIDLSLYKLVSSLPTSGIDADKIYLVASDTTGTSNVYTEYVYVNSAWEKLGEYKSDVDLTDYAKTADVDDALALKADKSDTYTKSEVDAKVTASGTFSEADATKLAGIEEGATKTEVDSELSSESENPVQNMVIKSALEEKLDKGLVLYTISSSSLSQDITSNEKTGLKGLKIESPLYLAWSNQSMYQMGLYIQGASSSSAGTMSGEDYAKLAAIDAAATADEALTDAEIEEAIAAA